MRSLILAHVRTVQGSRPSGASKVTAYGNGRQRSVNTDYALSVEENHKRAVLALMTRILAPVEEATIASLEVTQVTSTSGLLWKVTLP